MELSLAGCGAVTERPFEPEQEDGGGEKQARSLCLHPPDGTNYECTTRELIGQDDKHVNNRIPLPNDNHGASHSNTEAFHEVTDWRDSCADHQNDQTSNEGGRCSFTSLINPHRQHSC